MVPIAITGRVMKIQHLTIPTVSDSVGLGKFKNFGFLKSGSSGRFYFLGLQNCSHETRRCLLLGRKAITNLDSVLKRRYITLLTKVLIVKAMGFPIVVYGCEIWTIKKAECQRTDAFELWC